MQKKLRTLKYVRHSMDGLVVESQIYEVSFYSILLVLCSTLLVPYSTLNNGPVLTGVILTYSIGLGNSS